MPDVSAYGLACVLAGLGQCFETGVKKWPNAITHPLTQERSWEKYDPVGQFCERVLWSMPLSRHVLRLPRDPQLGLSVMIRWYADRGLRESCISLVHSPYTFLAPGMKDQSSDAQVTSR